MKNNLLFLVFRKEMSKKTRMLLVAENQGDLWGLPQLPLEQDDATTALTASSQLLREFFAQFFKKITLTCVKMVDESIWKVGSTFSQYTLYIIEIEPETKATDGLRVTFVTGSMLSNNLTSEAFDALSLPYVQSRLS